MLCQRRIDTHNPFVQTLGVPAVVAAPIIEAIVSRFYRYYVSVGEAAGI